MMGEILPRRCVGAHSSLADSPPRKNGKDRRSAERAFFIADRTRLWIKRR